MEGLKKVWKFPQNKGGDRTHSTFFLVSKGGLKMHFKFFYVILDHVFLHLRGSCFEGQYVFENEPV